MRTLPLLIIVSALAAATGCSSDDMHFEQRSTLQSRTTSLVLYDSGETGQGIMNEQTCRFDAFNGNIIADFDMPAPTTHLEDIRGTVAIARSADGIHVLDRDGWDHNNDIALAGVLSVRMTLDGVASLVQDADGCRVDWRNDDSVQTAALDASVCDNASGFAVDPVTAQVWIGHGDGVTSAMPGAVSEVSVPGNLLAFDEVSGSVYVATQGQSLVSAVDASGDLQWEREVSGGVYAMSDMGARGATAVINDAGSNVDLEVFDGFTGDKIADYDMPGVADITVSADAGTLSLVTPDEVYFYDVMEGSAPVEFNEVVTEPPPMFAD